MGDSMIKEIEIKQHFQLGNVKISLDDSLNLVIGESGSGKSLLIEAIAFLCGHELSKETKKQGKLHIEGKYILNDEILHLERLYENDEVHSKVCQKQTDNSEYSNIIQNNVRYYYQNFMVTAGITSEYIIDLINIKNHKNVTEYSDDFIAYIDTYKKYCELKTSLDELENDRELKKILSELEKHDLEQIKLVSEEYQKNASSIEKISEYTEIYDILSKFENNIINISVDLRKINNNIIDDLSEKFDSVIIEYQEKLSCIKNEKNKLSEQLENISTHNDAISVKNRLCRTYNCTIEELIMKKEKASNSKEIMLELGIDLELVLKSLKNIIDKLDKNDEIIHQIITKESDLVCMRIVDILNVLGFECINAKINSKKKKLNKYIRGKNGNYNYEILIDDGKKLKKVKQLSGGELSRLLIALSVQEIQTKSGKTVIYDEIDTGVSGEFSVKIGKEFNKISSNNQVIAISHNPQVCAKAKKLIKVEKKSSKMYSETFEISTKSIEDEIAKMILGNIYDKSAIEVAKQLINK